MFKGFSMYLQFLLNFQLNNDKRQLFRFIILLKALFKAIDSNYEFK